MRLIEGFPAQKFRDFSMLGQPLREGGLLSKGFSHFEKIISEDDECSISVSVHARNKY